MFGKPADIPHPEDALPGRDSAMTHTDTHFVSGNSIKDKVPETMHQAMFGLGCFWGAERKFWELEGVYSTAAGYAAGFTPNPTYEEVCTGMTGHNEVVLVHYDPDKVTYTDLLTCFWEAHDPTQGMRQGNDRGTQYRSGIYVYSQEQKQLAESSRQSFQQDLTESGYDIITTEILVVPPFYYAEDYHQQYLAKNPTGYCGLGGCGVKFSP